MGGYLQFNNKQNFQGEFFNVADDEPLKEFGKTSYINLLIGANNSRKSRFIRDILKETIFAETSEKVIYLSIKASNIIKAVLANLKDYSRKEITININLTADSADNFKHQKGWEQFVALAKSTNSRSLTLNEDYFNHLAGTVGSFFSDQSKITEYSSAINKTISVIDFISAYDQVSLNRLGISNFISFSHYLSITPYQTFQSQLIELSSVLKRLVNISTTFHTPFKIYIPTLRTAISLYEAKFDRSQKQKIVEDIYASTVQKHYNLATNETQNLRVFTGLGLYSSIKKGRNSRKETRKRFEAFEDFISENFFQSRNVEVIALEDEEPENQHIQLYIEGENDRELHDLGDGVQALIILLYPIFMAEAGTWLFIEEPELNMHPGLQHLFIKTLLTHPAIREKKLRFFMTSHSNHLLNFSLSHADAISVFSFEKQTTGTELRSNIRQVIGHDVEILKTLGVYNASVYMANCSLWVEGVSDRRYLSAFLFAYMRDQKKEKFHEDLHYGFFEYAGSNVSHYLFDTTVKVESDEFKRIKAHFLANRIFLLVDKDAGLSKQKKQQQLQEVSAKSDKFEFTTTEVIEVENLLSIPVLKMLLKDEVKVDNAVVDALQFKEQDYRDTRLGVYIKGLLPKQKLPAIVAESGTLTTPYKIKFADYVLKQVENGTITWDMIAENAAARKLTEKLYEFIYRHNHP